MIDQKKFGKFVTKLRREKNLTQGDLSDILFVGREAVSKWERGVTLPNHSVLIDLSELFGVTINELLYGERRTIENEKEVRNITSWLGTVTNKLNKVKKLFIISGILVIIIYFVTCFLFNYNALRIFSTYVSGENFTIKKGMIVTCQDKIYFNFGTVINHTEEDINGVALYYKENDNKIKLVEGSILDDLIIKTKEFEKLTDKDIKELFKNLYIEIFTDSLTDENKLEVDLNFKTNLFGNVGNKDLKDNPEIDDLDSTDVHKIGTSEEDRIKSKFKLKDGEYIYEFKYKGKTYKCGLQDDTIQLVNKNFLLRYRINTDYIIITKDNNENSFNIKTNKCESGNCKKYNDIIKIFVEKVLN